MYSSGHKWGDYLEFQKGAAIVINLWCGDLLQNEAELTEIIPIN
jgi:hypothetical protein